MRCIVWQIILAVIVVGAGQEAWGQVEFTPVSGAFGAMSRNGQFVLTQQPNRDVSVWSRVGGQVATGLNVGVNGSVAGISDDGLVITGARRNSSNQSIAFRWTAAEGFTDLGDLPGGNTSSVPTDMSRDGSVIVGNSSSANSGTRNEGFRWTAATGIQPIGDLPGGNYTSVARAVSADGNVIAGNSGREGGNEAFRYTVGGGMVPLGDIAGGAFNSQAYGISSDGNVLVGYGNDALMREQSFRWTQSTGLVELGFASSDLNEWSQSHAVSNDGSIVVGTNQFNALIWNQAHGMRQLQPALLQDYGLTLPGWSLTGAWGVSDDGRSIAGSGSLNGQSQTWVLAVPEPGAMAAIGLLMPMLAVRRGQRDGAADVQRSLCR